MKFIWSVKDELSACQMVDTVWSVSSVGFFVWSQLFSTVTADTQTITPYVYMYMQILAAAIQLQNEMQVWELPSVYCSVSA